MLEKIVKYVKIAFTNRFIPLGYGVAGISLGSIFADGKINSRDKYSLLIGGFATLISLTASEDEHRKYKNIEQICKNEGFIEKIMKDKDYRRKAKIYAAESGRMNEFAEALKRYEG